MWMDRQAAGEQTQWQTKRLACFLTELYYWTYNLTWTYIKSKAEVATLMSVEQWIQMLISWIQEQLWLHDYVDIKKQMIAIHIKYVEPHRLHGWPTLSPPSKQPWVQFPSPHGCLRGFFSNNWSMCGGGGTHMLERLGGCSKKPAYTP